MTAWDSLDRELDAWRAAGREPTLWCRDDDACRDTPALRQLLAIADEHDFPIALAAIPASLAPDLAELVLSSRVATVIQHGYAHANFAPPALRKQELGTHRPIDTTVGELERGQCALRQAFGSRFRSVLVPPWNRIDTAVIERLPGAGFAGVSTLGPRALRSPVQGLVQCNAHVDLIAWRRDRGFVGVDAAIGRIVLHLEARREGGVDVSEPTGILTHHLDMDAAGRRFVGDLVQRTRQRGAVWLDVDAAFFASPPSRTTSGRSA